MHTSKANGAQTPVTCSEDCLFTICAKHIELYQHVEHCTHSGTIAGPH